MTESAMMLVIMIGICVIAGILLFWFFAGLFSKPQLHITSNVEVKSPTSQFVREMDGLIESLKKRTGKKTDEAMKAPEA